MGFFIHNPLTHRIRHYFEANPGRIRVEFGEMLANCRNNYKNFGKTVDWLGKAG